MQIPERALIAAREQVQAEVAKLQQDLQEALAYR